MSAAQKSAAINPKDKIASVNMMHLPSWNKGCRGRRPRSTGKEYPRAPLVSRSSAAGARPITRGRRPRSQDTRAAWSAAWSAARGARPRPPAPARARAAKSLSAKSLSAKSLSMMLERKNRIWIDSKIPDCKLPLKFPRFFILIPRRRSL